MKIIDEKGRLFGKINVIDFLALIFLLCLTPMFYFGYKIYSKESRKAEGQALAQNPKERFTIMINCKFIKLKPEAIKIIQVGAKEFDNKGNLICEIVSLGEFSPYIYKFNIGPNQTLIREDPSLQQVEATLKINAEARDKGIYYRDTQILVGGTFETFFGGYSVAAEDIAIIKDNYSTLIATKSLGSPVKDSENAKKYELQLSKLEEKLDGSLRELSGKIAGLEELKGKISELEGLSGKIAGLEELKGKISELEGLSGKIAGLEELKGKISELEGLSGKIAGLEELKAKIADLAFTIEQIKDEMAGKKTRK